MKRRWKRDTNVHTPREKVETHECTLRRQQSRNENKRFLSIRDPSKFPKKKKKRRAYTRLFNERERILIGNCYRRFSLASANKVRVIRRQRYSTNETRSSLVFLRRDSPRVCRVTFSPTVSGKGRKINNRQRRQRQTSKTFRPIG